MASPLLSTGTLVAASIKRLSHEEANTQTESLAGQQHCYSLAAINMRKSWQQTAALNAAGQTDDTAAGMASVEDPTYRASDKRPAPGAADPDADCDPPAPKRSKILHEGEMAKGVFTVHLSCCLCRWVLHLSL